MNIKQHIEAGHYPTDSKGRALVPVIGGATATICATDAPGARPVIGFIRGPKSTDTVCECLWTAEGVHNIPAGAWVDLLPPPPRKVEVKGWMIVNRFGKSVRITDTSRESITNDMRDGDTLVELTGSYEEPWE